jgi:enoyl-CoA hydratase/carnithine racemase
VILAQVRIGPAALFGDGPSLPTDSPLKLLLEALATLVGASVAGFVRTGQTCSGLELAMVGDPIDARTALAWGLVNRVVPRAELDKATDALARAASRGSLASKALGKRTFYGTIDLDL